MSFSVFFKAVDIHSTIFDHLGKEALKRWELKQGLSDGSPHGAAATCSKLYLKCFFFLNVHL